MYLLHFYEVSLILMNFDIVFAVVPLAREFLKRGSTTDVVNLDIMKNTRMSWGH